VEVPEAVSLAAELIKLNTSNPGQMERGAASLVADALREAGASIRWWHPLLRIAPMQLPDDLDFTALFHGVDERVPVAALDFGTRVLQTLFAAY
jgi:acetylornithine deacetylase/succinyl-diaminopimelate desuccinylase-like protein